jgi:hypothetical protein
MCYNSGMSSKKRGADPVQLTFEELLRKRRKGGGRKKSPNSGVSHLKRPELKERHPVHTTLKLLDGFPSLRGRRQTLVVLDALRRACRGTAREPGGLHVCHYSIQDDHAHLIVEAQDKETLARGIQGLSIRLAKGLNKLWGRTGKVFADRYHEHVLETPTEVRNALAYLFRNWKKHGVEREENGLPDELSSGRWFEGWTDYVACSMSKALGSSPIAEARTWLLRVGWARAGPLVLAEVHG